MRCKFVVRLLDAADALLGWAEVFVEPRSGGEFVLDAPLLVPFEAEGDVVRMSIHWTDLDVARVGSVGPIPAQPGAAASIPIGFCLWAVPTDPRAPKPGVTIRTSVTLSPAPAGVGAIGPGA